MDLDERELSPDEVRDLEALNGLRQYDLMDEMIQEATSTGAEFRLRPYHLTELNEAAVRGLSRTAGSFRYQHMAIQGSSHQPPDPRRVARLVDEMCDVVNRDWSKKPATWLAAYVMWRLNWIHPFEDGNGRTSRTAAYLVLCAKVGSRLPGRTTIPEIIAQDKHPY